MKFPIKYNLLCKKIESGTIFHDLELDPDLSKRSRIRILIWTHNTGFKSDLMYLLYGGTYSTVSVNAKPLPGWCVWYAQRPPYTHWTQSAQIII
jgi:hypothetical protein